MHPSFIVLTVSFFLLISNAHAGAQSEDGTLDSVTDVWFFPF